MSINIDFNAEPWPYSSIFLPFLAFLSQNSSRAKPRVPNSFRASVTKETHYHHCGGDSADTWVIGTLVFFIKLVFILEKVAAGQLCTWLEFHLDFSSVAWKDIRVLGAGEEVTVAFTGTGPVQMSPQNTVGWIGLLRGIANESKHA